MKKYKKDRTCPKCGGKAHNRYCEECDWIKLSYTRCAVGTHNKPVINRGCKDCGYKWSELPFDAKGAGK